MIHIGQGHYLRASRGVTFAKAKAEAQKFANSKNEVVAFQKWIPRGKPILLRPKNSKFSKMSEEEIIQDYKKEGYDVRNYGGH